MGLADQFILGKASVIGRLHVEAHRNNQDGLSIFSCTYKARRKARGPKGPFSLTKFFYLQGTLALLRCLCTE